MASQVSHVAGPGAVKWPVLSEQHARARPTDAKSTQMVCMSSEIGVSSVLSEAAWLLLGLSSGLSKAKIGLSQVFVCKMLFS